MNLSHYFERPVFVISTPRSGSTLLFETLSGADGLYTIGGESHSLIEGIRELHPAFNNYESNRLTLENYDPKVAESLMHRFLSRLRDADNQGVLPGSSPIRMLEKTPKNALRIGFLNAVFPDALFIYLHRDIGSVLGSMMDGWVSGHFRTYPSLPEWSGLPWSFLLTPGWRELNGKKLTEVVCRQWQATTTAILDDIGSLPSDRWMATSYVDFLSDPQAESDRLCNWIGVPCIRSLGNDLPLSRHTLSKPDPNKWRRYESELRPYFQEFTPLIQRANNLLLNARR